MDEFEQAVLTTVSNLTVLYAQISRLLITADGQMRTGGWKPWPYSYAVTGSNAIENHQDWIKKTVHRVYQSAQKPQGFLLPFIAVHLYDPAFPEQTTLPRITAGVIRFPGVVESFGTYQICRVHLSVDPLPPQGQVFPVEPPGGDAKVWQSGSLFWQPLAAINNQEQLDGLVTSQLLALINQTSG